MVCGDAPQCRSLTRRQVRARATPKDRCRRRSRTAARRRQQYWPSRSAPSAGHAAGALLQSVSGRAPWRALRFACCPSLRPVPLRTSPPEDLLFSMSSTLSARSSAVEPGSRASGAKVASGTNGPESALCDDQSSDLGLSSGDLSHALETVPPQSRSNPAGIFRGTHARGHDPQEPVCALAASLPPARVLLSVLAPLHLQPDQPPSSTFCGYPKITQRYNLPSTGLASSVYIRQSTTRWRAVHQILTHGHANTTLLAVCRMSHPNLAGAAGILASYQTRQVAAAAGAPSTCAMWCTMG